MAKKAFFVIGPEGCGTYMLAEAFVSAGCTYCDKDDVGEFLEGQAPELLVLRRSMPHAGKFPDFHLIYSILTGYGYDTMFIGIIRDEVSATISVNSRDKSRIASPQYHRALMILGSVLELGHGVLLSYEYFVSSAAYRNKIFTGLGLQPPEMELYDGNAKYYG